MVWLSAHPSHKKSGRYNYFFDTGPKLFDEPHCSVSRIMSWTLVYQLVAMLVGVGLYTITDTRNLEHVSCGTNRLGVVFIALFRTL